MKQNHTTAGSVFRALTERNPDIVGSFDEVTYSLTVFLTVKGVLDFDEWRKRSERVRRVATMQESTVLPGVWTRDPTKPRLVDTPAHAVTYDRRTDLFLPAVNVATVTQVDFYRALAEATAAASEATLFRERNGNLPGSGDLSRPVTIFYPGSTPGTDAGPEITDLLSRINGDRGSSTAAGSASGRGTSQIATMSFSRPQPLQMPGPDRYHRRIRT